MSSVTLTEFRKNLFQMIDRVIETGEPLHLTRKGRPIVIGLARPDSLTPRAEYDAYMALGVREDAADFDAGDPSDKTHWSWSPDLKTRP